MRGARGQHGTNTTQKSFDLFLIFIGFFERLVGCYARFGDGPSNFCIVFISDLDVLHVKISGRAVVRKSHTRDVIRVLNVVLGQMCILKKQKSECLAVLVFIPCTDGIKILLSQSSKSFGELGVRFRFLARTVLYFAIQVYQPA